MCGIVGVIAPSGQLPLTVLHDMRDRLRHRGPDGAGSWIGETGAGVVGLAHRRLSIIDLSDAAAQPMFSPDRRAVIVYNGEIYNFVELRRELESHGVAFRTRSDTEVLLASYLRWGVRCIDRLNGMFAFLIWDATTDELFVARDRFGEKPLFVARLPLGGIAFTSEMKALFAHPELFATADEQVVVRYAAGQYYEDGEETLFEGVMRFPPAHAMVVDSRGRVTRRWRYWIPDYTVGADYEPRTAAATFRELLERSVSIRLRSDVPIGTSLSGGLDSSSLVCLLSRLRGQSATTTQNTFSARFDADPTMSEGPFIDLVAAHARVDSYSVAPDPGRLIDESERLHWHQEEPFLSASIYLQWCVARLAREHRTTVLIDGQGADELLAGYQFYYRSYQLDLIDRHRYVALLRDTVRFNRRLRHAADEYVNARRRFNARIGLSGAELAAALVRRPGLSSGPYTVGVPLPRRGVRLRRQIAEALQYNSLPALLRYADRNSMAFGRETRLPFLDYQLVDWCVRLPDRAFIHGGWQKHILRLATERIVPDAVRWRADKVGYAAPLDLWLRGPLKDWAYEELFNGLTTDVPGYESRAVRDLWTEHQEGRKENSWPLWRWISLNQWLRLMKNGAWRTGLGSAWLPQ
jgi:asparagine synthase (glutamine-hydrolysing)